MRRKELTVIVGIAMVLSTFAGLAVSGSVPGEGASPAYITHAPIRINSNAEFASMALAEGWAGNGTSANPYVIEGYDIDGPPEDSCILIFDTTVFFVIRDCYLHSMYYGLGLMSVWNGVIYNNTISYNDLGVFMQEPRNIEFSNNIISYNSGSGIMLDQCVWNGIYIYHNNFINNLDQPDIDGSAHWDNGYPSGGNYWNDYAGSDANGDGIGDTPYTFTGGQDVYPLMDPVVNGRVQRPPIRIDSNVDFDPSHGVSAGNGTEADPYIIENYDIDGTGLGHCLYVGNTTAHFVVRGCRLLNASGVGTEYYRNDGITLHNVQSAVIENNEVYGNGQNGIYAYNSTMLLIAGNTIGGSVTGKHGVALVDVTWSNARNNNISCCENGIWLDGSYDNIIESNILTGNWHGIQMDGAGRNYIPGNHIFANMYYGMWMDAQSNENTVTDNLIEGNWRGIYLFDSDSNNMTENTITGSSNFGLQLDGSNSNIITDNYIGGCGLGIKDYFSTSNSIFHNTFTENDVQATSSGVNAWDDGYPFGGNYWSDYTGIDAMSGLLQNILGSDGIGDTPYVIDADSQDNYPLMAPWTSTLTAVALPVYQEVNPGVNAFFDASLSTGDITNFTWDFGDRTSGTGITASHSYSYSGYFLVTLTVSNGSSIATDTCIVKVLGMQDPYPIYGYVKDADIGTKLAGCTVEVTYFDGSLGSWHTLTTASSGLGQYIVDLNNYIFDSPVFCNVTANPVNGKPGANSSFVDVFGSPGGRQVDILCEVAPACDLSISQNDITFSNSNPAKWDEVTINAEVRWNMIPQVPAINLVKTVDKSQALPGDTLMYTIYFNNTGNSDATCLGVNETYPAGVTFINANPAPFVFHDNYWEISTLPAGDSITIFINVSINTGVALDTLLTNEVTVVYCDPNYNVMPIEYANTTTVVIGPLTGLEKWGPATALAGETITYWINYLNTGTDWAYNIIITEIYPADVTFVSAIPVPSIPGNVWNIGYLAPGSSNIIEVTVQVNMGATGILTNHVIMDSENSAGMPTQLHAWCNTTIECPYLALTKSAPATASPGATIMYTINYMNVGTSLAENVIITETYPAGVTFLDASPAPAIMPNVWVIGSLLPGAHGTILINMTVNLGATGVLTNWVQVDHENELGMPMPTEYDSSTTIVIAPLTELTKCGPATALAGETIVYEIYYWNNGTDWAYNNVITEIYPPGISFVSALPAPSFGDNVWLIPAIGPGSSGSIFVIVQISTGATGTLTNHVIMDSEDSIGNPTQLHAWCNTTIIPGPDIMLVKSAPATASPGEIIVYTITYTNVGSSTAYNITITETYPPWTTYVGSTIPPSMGNNVWVIPSLPPNSEFYINITMQVNLGTEGLLLTNSVRADYENEVEMPMPTEYANATSSVPSGLSEGAYVIMMNDPGEIVLSGTALAEPMAGYKAACTVSFYLDSIGPENLIYREYGVQVPYGGSVNVFANWLCNIAGEHTVIVDVTDSDPADVDILNNIASKAISIAEPCGKLKVKASSDKQKYVTGTDGQAEIIVKVTYLGSTVGGADVSCIVSDPNGANGSVTLTEAYEGLYVGGYPFTNTSVTGTYRINAIATKLGYLQGENNDAKDKFFLDAMVPQLPEVVSTTMAHVLEAGTDLAVTANILNPTGVESIFATLSGHAHWGTFVSPMFDDGTHSDAVVGDGIFTAAFETADMTDTYLLDISVNGIAFEKLDAIVVSPLDYVAIDSFTGLDTSGSFVEIASPLTNVTIGLNTVSDISDINFLIVEHRNATGGKDLEFIPSGNAITAMTFAHIEMKYAEEDIPANVSEDSLLLWVYNIYTERLEPCLPSGVDTLGDLIWGDTEHFSEFKMMSAPEGMSAHTILLIPGWNLISIPIQQDNEAIERVLSPIDGLWDVTKYYDNTDVFDPWKTYRVGSSINDLHEVDPTMALWVHMNSSAQLPLFGVQRTSTQIQLYSGWNFVGYPTLHSDVTVGDALWGTGADKVEVFNQASPYFLMSVGSTYVLTPGQGLWVHVPADSVWTING